MKLAFCWILALANGEPRVWASSELAAMMSDSIDVYAKEIFTKYDIIENTEATNVDSFRENPAILNAAVQSEITKNAEDTIDTIFEIDEKSIGQIFAESMTVALEPLKKYGIIKNVKAIDDESNIDGFVNFNLNGKQFAFNPDISITDITEILSISSSTDLSAFSAILKLQADVIPILHDLLPSGHIAFLTALQGLDILRSDTIDPTVLFPSLIELVSALVVLQNSAEPLVAIGHAYYRKLQKINMSLIDYSSFVPRLSGFVEKLMGRNVYREGGIKQVIDALAAMNPAWERITETFMEEKSVVYDMILNYFDTGPDMHTGLSELIAHFKAKETYYSDMYDNPQQFLAVVLNNVMKLTRYTGSLSRSDEITRVLKSVTRIFHEIRNIDPHMINDLVKGLINTCNDFEAIPTFGPLWCNVTIDASVVITHSFKRLIPVLDNMLATLYALEPQNMSLSDLGYAFKPIAKSIGSVLPELATTTVILRPMIVTGKLVTDKLNLVLDILEVSHQCTNFCSTHLAAAVGCASRQLAKSIVLFGKLLM